MTLFTISAHYLQVSIEQHIVLLPKLPLTSVQNQGIVDFTGSVQAWALCQADSSAIISLQHISPEWELTLDVSGASVAGRPAKALIITWPQEEWGHLHLISIFFVFFFI